MNDVNEVRGELAANGIQIDDETLEDLLDQYELVHEDAMYPDIAELPDRSDHVYVFGFPTDADPASIQPLAREIADQFENAGIVVTAAKMESTDVLISKVKHVQ